MSPTRLYFGDAAPSPRLGPIRGGGAAAPTEKDLIAHVSRQLGKPLAPKHVFVVAALPKTRSGKIIRAAILRVFLGQPAGDLTSVDNPAALEAIRALSR